MNFWALLKKLFSSMKQSVRDRTETTAGVYRTSGNLFYRFAIIPGIPLLIKLPLVFFAFVTSAGVGHGPDVGAGAGIVALFFVWGSVVELLLFVPAILLGRYLRNKADGFDEEEPATKEALWHCGCLLFGIALLLLSPIVMPVLSYLLGALLSGDAIADGFFTLIFAYFFILLHVSGGTVIPLGVFGLFVGTLLAFGLYVLWIAIDLLKRSKEANSLTARLVSVVMTPVQKLSRVTEVGIEKGISTDARAYRICGVISYLFAAVLILPVAWFQVTRVVLRGGMTPLVDIWMTGGSEANSQEIIPILGMLAILLLMAALAVAKGRKLFAQARKSSENTGLDPQVCLRCGRFLKRIAWLILVILPMAIVLAPTVFLGYRARYWKPDRLFAAVNDSWRVAKSSFLWLQLYPLLALGIVAAVLAIVLLTRHAKQGEEK